MENCIAILPEHVANQIAAGEVIQQPASAVKELMENSIDAGATHIDVVLKEGGRNLIQVSDDGKGMSPEDARLCFDRHATSKLHNADDLFHIRTMGFRGEALASIAAIAQVELVTRRPEDEIGTKVGISASQLDVQESIVCECGTRFSVRNLFFNVPARRKFMGAPAKQLAAVRNEFIQVALAHPECHFSLSNNGESLLQLPAGNLRSRIGAIFGDQLNKKLYPIDIDTEFIKISGFIGDPQASRKRNAEQFFFVNGRYIRHPYFRKALTQVYEPLTLPGMQPVFFLFFQVDPENIDVNVSPTKTEVKFDNDQIIWQILTASVREALGRNNAVPSIDFDQEDAPEISILPNSHEKPKAPDVHYRPDYNPFRQAADFDDYPELPEIIPSKSAEHPVRELREPYHTRHEGGQSFFESSDRPSPQAIHQALDLYDNASHSSLELFQLFGRYIAFPTSEALFLMDQHRAVLSLRYDEYCGRISAQQSCSQTLLFPEILELGPNRMPDFLSLRPTLETLGFRFEEEYNEDLVSFLICGVPDHAINLPPNPLISELLDAADEHSADAIVDEEQNRHRIALQLARSTAIPYGQKLCQSEMQDIFERFRQRESTFDPEGKTVVVRLCDKELIQRFH